MGGFSLFRDDLPSINHFTGIHGLEQDLDTALTCHSAVREYVFMLHAASLSLVIACKCVDAGGLYATVRAHPYIELQSLIVSVPLFF